MYENRVGELVLATLAADSHALGSHWVYDADELQNLKIDWEALNTPSVAWHEGKTKGDFTHYGDQIVILDTFLKDKSHFDLDTYMRYWYEKMQTFKGYRDGSIKDTLLNMDNGMANPCGSSSGDMSVIGRIVPLLKVSSSQKVFLENTKQFAQATHNNELVLEAMHFFASLLVEVLEGKRIRQSVEELKENYSERIQKYIDLGIQSKDEETFTSIATFGSACSVASSFPGTIHILFKYSDYKEALIQNAKAGGDSSARAMIISYLMVAQDSIEIVPKEWLGFNRI